MGKKRKGKISAPQMKPTPFKAGYTFKSNEVDARSPSEVRLVRQRKTQPHCGSGFREALDNGTQERTGTDGQLVPPCVSSGFPETIGMHRLVRLARFSPLRLISVLVTLVVFLLHVRYPSAAPLSRHTAHAKHHDEVDSTNGTFHAAYFVPRANLAQLRNVIRT